MERLRVMCAFPHYLALFPYHYSFYPLLFPFHNLSLSAYRLKRGPQHLRNKFHVTLFLPLPTFHIHG